MSRTKLCSNMPFSFPSSTRGSCRKLKRPLRDCALVRRSKCTAAPLPVLRVVPADALCLNCSSSPLHSLTHQEQLWASTADFARDMGMMNHSYVVSGDKRSFFQRAPSIWDTCVAGTTRRCEPPARRPGGCDREDGAIPPCPPRRSLYPRRRDGGAGRHGQHAGIRAGPKQPGRVRARPAAGVRSRPQPDAGRFGWRAPITSLLVSSASRNSGSASASWPRSCSSHTRQVADGMDPSSDFGRRAPPASFSPLRETAAPHPQACPDAGAAAPPCQ